MRFQTFEQFTFEQANKSDLHKVYLAIKPQSGHRWWNYKEFAGEKFFTKITLENYKDMDIDQSMPVLTYNSKVVNQLIKEGLIKEENIINHPKYIADSGSKAKFHQIVEGDENVPNTVFKKEDASKLGFPIIAKPAAGHSGIGIQVIKDQKEFDKADHSKFDVYSEYIDKDSEHRLITYKGETLCWMEREPMNDKASSGKGKSDEKMDFKYIKKDPKTLPESFKKMVEKFAKKFENLPFITFDVMEDKSGKPYLIETNIQPGVPYDSTVEIYKKVFEDFYGHPVSDSTLKELDQFSEDLNKKTLELNPDRFEIK